MHINLEPRQTDAYTTEATEVLYGGAAGGGKSFYLRVSAIRWCLEVPGIQVYLFRRTLTDLRDNHLRGPTSFFVLLAEGIERKQIRYRAVENEFEFPGNSTLHLCYCDSENDVEKYRGAEMHCLEENENVRMADGSRKRIGEIMVGDFVSTLQGSRQIKWVGKRELKPCVTAKVSYDGVVTQQIHSETHKVLTPAGWFSYGDIVNEFRPSLICEPIQNRSSHKYAEPFASGHRSVQQSRGSPYQGQERKSEFVQLFQGLKDESENVSCKALQAQEIDCVSSLGGIQEYDKPPSVFSFPVVLHAQNHRSEEEVFVPVTQRDAESCVLNGCMDEGSQSGYRLSGDYGGEYQHRHLNKNRDDAHISVGVVEHNPKSSLLDDPDIIQKHSLYKSLQYRHPYTGEERTAGEAACLGTCVVTPCGEKWTIDIMVEGENHYITESGLINKNCLILDELTHFSEYQYRFLRSRVRRAGLKVTDAYKARLPRIEAGSNPGSIGHAWVKRSFISPKPPMEKWKTPPEEGGMLRQFIPAKLSDNPHLTNDDPEYANRLKGLGADSLVRAMLDGDWDIVAGQAFEKLRRDLHGIEPFLPPDDWAIFGSLDWGSSRPFSLGLWTISNGNPLPDGRLYRRGAMIRYNEWYGWNGTPNEGLRMEVGEVAQGIVKKLAGRRPEFIIADPSMWKVDGGPSHAESMLKHGVVLRRADNSRVAGYLEVRNRIAGDEDGPMLFATKNCHDGFWRTMPDVIMDRLHPEDVDTDQEEHCYDEVRYAAMSRPWMSAPKVKKVVARDWLFDQREVEEDTWRTA